MPVRTVSLNLSQADTSISPMDSKPIEFTAGQNFYKPESSATGGSRFQHHRLFRTYNYAMNCVKTESGFESVKSNAIRAQKLLEGNHGKLAYISDCFSDEENLIVYDPSLYRVSSSLQGSVVSSGECERVMVSEGTVEGYSSFNNLDIKAIKTAHPDVLGFVRVQAYLIWWTRSQLFYNSYLNLNDYAPNESTGAGSTSIVADVGAIVKVLPNRKGLYVFGTRGAIYGSFTQDVRYPFSFTPVSNHDGVPSADCVGFDFEVETFIAMSQSGLQRIKGNQATYKLPDISRSIMRDIVVDINIRGMETGRFDQGKGVKGTQYEVQIPAEYRDNTNREFDFYQEFVSSSGRNPHVMVNNVSPRYTLISYARVGDVYHRLLVIDNYLDGSSVIHVKHEDTIRPRHGYNELFIYSYKGEVFVVVEGGRGLLLFMEFQKASGRSTTISRAVAYGRFQKEQVDKSSNSIHFLKGFDQINSDYLSCSMHMTGHSQREINYAGRVTDKILSFAVPFKGRLNEIVLNYK